MSTDLPATGLTSPGDPEDGGDLDPNDVRLATDPLDELSDFNRAGVLGPADVHGARTLCDLVGDHRPGVALAAALAIRAPQHGHVCVELDRIAATATGFDEAPVALTDLEWPDPAAWRELLTTSPLVRVRPAGTPEVLDPLQDRPLSLVGSRLYLDRYWRYERRVAEVLRARAARTTDGLAGDGAADVDPAVLRAALDRLLPAGDERPDRQRLAVATGVLRGLTVIAGGPGTGKTHTVARLLALLHELADRPGQPGGGHRLRVAVAAPTGKAADRLTTALREAADTVDTHDDVRRRLRSLEATTIHRLLGGRPGSTRFRHDRQHKLPHELVVIDETSMVDLPLMAKLLVALRKETRLVLVGDPDQLASVEAGAVLADIVGQADERLRMTPDTRAALSAATGEPLEDVAPARPKGIDDAIVVLGKVRRYRADSGIARLATAIHTGDADAALAALRGGGPDVAWIETSGEAVADTPLTPVRDAVVAAFRPVHDAALAGDGSAALAALDRLRILCAHRRGPVGVSGWIPLVERWLTEDVPGFDPSERWYPGRPVLVTRNDRRLRLYNGDIGVVVRGEDGLRVVFAGGAGTRSFGPSRLEDVETVHAMTIHKSQGSQFDHVVVVLPDETSPILTRELLYTAVTRAQSGVTVVGPESSVRAAIGRRVARASGLRETLWGTTEPEVIS